MGGEAHYAMTAQFRITVFLDDLEVERMTGCKRGKQRPSTLLAWLEENGYVLGVTCFERVDGWYSVMSPHARSVDVTRPKLRAAV